MLERTVRTVAKIGLSDVDNKRGYEMTVTGSGFNDGTTAGVYVLANARHRRVVGHPELREMVDAVGMDRRHRRVSGFRRRTMRMAQCSVYWMYALGLVNGTRSEMYSVVFTLCRMIMPRRSGTKVGARWLAATTRSR